MTAPLTPLLLFALVMLTGLSLFSGFCLWRELLNIGLEAEQ